MRKLKERWGIASNKQLFVILLVFSITGSTAAYIARPILEFMGIYRSETHPLLYWPLYLILLYPFYQVLLLIYAYLFGQFSFFWPFVRKFLVRMRLYKPKN